MSRAADDIPPTGTPTDPDAEGFDGDLTLSDRELFERVGWFTTVRWGAGLAAWGFMALGWVAFDVRFRWAPAAGVIAALLAVNALFALRARHLHRGRRIRRASVHRLAHAQIVCDLLAVAGLVHFIGGVENHFIILFIFPMIVASEFFRPAAAYGYAALAAVLINAIGWGEYFVEELRTPLAVQTPQGLVPLIGGHAGAGSLLFVLQVTFVMTFAVFVTVFVACSIAARLRGREEELGRAYRDLRSLEQVKSQFMRKTSHELRAPVGAVQSLLKSALVQMGDSGPGRELVNRATERTENMLDLIDDLLRWSRLRSARVAERFEPVEMAEIVRASAAMFRAQAEEKGVELEVEAAPATVRGARDSLTDLVNNLVSNAIRYTPEGGRVRVELECEGERTRLEVADTGIGIPADELPRVFDEFFRGSRAKKTVAHGTGLGMTIIKRVVDMHGGEIEVDSTEGEGTTFRVSLPACRRE